MPQRTWDSHVLLIPLPFAVAMGCLVKNLRDNIHMLTAPLSEPAEYPPRSATNAGRDDATGGSVDAVARKMALFRRSDPVLCMAEIPI